MVRLNLLLIATLISISGCTNQALYENIQADQKFKCSQLPQAQYEECMERASKSYDEYEREREELLQEQ